MINVTSTTPATFTSTTPELTTATPATNTTYGLVGLVLFAVVIIIMIILRKECNKRRHLSIKRHHRHSSGVDSFASEEDGAVVTQRHNDVISDRNQSAVMCSEKQNVETGLPSYWGGIDPGVQSMTQHCLINIKRLTKGKVIGKGQFGCVYEGRLTKEPRVSNDYGPLTHQMVAVKTLRAKGLQCDLVEAFLREGMIMKDFNHDNVLTLIGVAIGRQEEPLIVLPFMANGSLKKYVSNPDKLLTVQDLLLFGRQVALGMQYLADQRFVHRDLAARNCMLDEELVVKVADFGLSRDIYTKHYYSSSDQKTKLPVKWMALECLTKSVYTTKSDVWSYGVLLWELMTRGAMPYPDVANWDIRHYIQQGRRMAQPDMCPDEVYNMMLKCWDALTDNRPMFAEIATEIHQILAPSRGNSMEDGSYVETDHVYVNLFSNVMAPPEDLRGDITGSSFGTGTGT